MGDAECAHDGDAPGTMRPVGRREAMAKIERGVEQARNGQWIPFEEVMADIRRELGL